MRQAAERAAVVEIAAKDAAENGDASEEVTVASANKVSAEEADKHNKDTRSDLAVEARKEKVVLVEPEDEIENDSIIDETKKRDGEFCATISVIPVRHLNAKDVDLQRAIKDKIEAKSVKVENVFIQRSKQGTFTRCDVVIEPMEGKVLEDIDFEFENCRAFPFYGCS